MIVLHLEDIILLVIVSLGLGFIAFIYIGIFIENKINKIKDKINKFKNRNR